MLSAPTFVSIAQTFLHISFTFSHFTAHYSGSSPRTNIAISKFVRRMFVRTNIVKFFL